jgi:hypothetical protein
MESKHYLVVESEDEGDWHIEHPTSCKLITETEGHIVVRRYACDVGNILDWYGIDDLRDNDPDDKLHTPGRYEISAYVYTPQSMFEDAEAYIEFVE